MKSDFYYKPNSRRKTWHVLKSTCPLPDLGIKDD